MTLLCTVKVLGSGASGKVLLARHRGNKRWVAVKEIPMTGESNLKSFLRERELLRKFSNLFSPRVLTTPFPLQTTMTYI